MTEKGFTICLWFDTAAEEAATYYVSIFKDASLGRTTRFTEAGPRAAGMVLTTEFELNGQKFVAVNGGPEFTFDEAVSIQIPCADQDEVDYYWDKLTADGGQESACGWLKDKYGLSWQVVPTALTKMIADTDPERASRTMAAMLKMRKIDIATLQRVYAGE